jgi:hypothetical protein
MPRYPRIFPAFVGEIPSLERENPRIVSGMPRFFPKAVRQMGGRAGLVGELRAFLTDGGDFAGGASRQRSGFVGQGCLSIAWFDVCAVGGCLQF